MALSRGGGGTAVVTVTYTSAGGKTERLDVPARTNVVNGAEVSPANPFPVAVTGNPGTVVDKSGTITAGGTAQTAIASNAARNGFSIQNQSTGDLYFNTLAAAVVGQPSIRVGPGLLYETPANGFGTGAVSIIGATTGQAFAAREY